MDLVEKLSDVAAKLKTQAQSASELSDVFVNVGFEVKQYGDEKFAAGQAAGGGSSEPGVPSDKIYSQAEMDAKLEAKDLEYKQSMIDKDAKILELQNEVDAKVAAAVKAAVDAEVAAFIKKYEDVSVDNAAMLNEYKARIQVS